MTSSFRLKPMLLAVLLLMGIWHFFPVGTLATNSAQADDAPATPPATVTPEGRPDEWWQSRHKMMNTRAELDPYDVFFIGDSITHDWEGTGKDIWAKHYAPRKAVNLGISGDRTEHVLWRLDDGNLKGINPKLAVIMIGTNNSGSNTSEDITSEDIAAGVEGIVKKLREQRPEIKVLVLGIFPRGEKPEDGLRQVNMKANEILEKQ